MSQDQDHGLDQGKGTKYTIILSHVSRPRTAFTIVVSHHKLFVYPEITVFTYYHRRRRWSKRSYVIVLLSPKCDILNSIIHVTKRLTTYEFLFKKLTNTVSCAQKTYNHDALSRTSLHRNQKS